MMKYFGIPIEFDRDVLESTIETTAVTGKGYCCFVDSFVLVTARKKQSGLIEVLENSLVNACDGSYIALLASRLYKKSFKAYNGPELFTKFIYSDCKQCIIGNTVDVFNKVKARLVSEGYNAENLLYVSLPFDSLDNYNYEEIASAVNDFAPSYIWVSLGAPKQEFFMARFLPFLNSGVMMGIGAALNYFSGEIKDIPQWAVKSHTIWFYRILTEPRKQFKRSFFILRNYFEIYFSEKKYIYEDIDKRNERFRRE